MILLDTHVLLWARQDPDRLPPSAATVVSSASEWTISDITLWEIAMLVRKDRIRVPGSLDSYLDEISATTSVRPISAAVAAVVGTLPLDFPASDPADRIIYATAQVHGLSLVSADRQLRAYDPSIVWD